MQRLIYLCSRTSRLYQVVGVNHLKHSELLINKSNVLSYTNILTFKRCLTTKNNNTEHIDTHPDLYKASTTKQATHIPDELKGGQSIETIDTNIGNPLTGGGKVWSAQDPDGIHIASRSEIQSTTFIPKSTEGGTTAHEPIVYSTQGKVNTADPFTIHNLKGESTTAQLAEEAAASAFEISSQNTPLKSTSTSESVFAPKISSIGVHSPTSSPTAHFDTTNPASLQQDSIKYESANKPKVFGGQNTSADTKKRPKENPFDLKEQNKPSSYSNDISNQSESDIRNNILHESLKYVHEKGWSMEAIRAGINACHQPAIAEQLFYNGYDLVEYFMHHANSEMITYMNELAMKENIEGTRLFIDGLKYRLKLVIPYADTWQQALAQKGFPQNAKRAWKNLLDLADDAWISIGDTATDIKWYTKRLSVATIYRSAEIYMLQDQSINKIETMNFLERHLDDFQTTGSVRSDLRFPNVYQIRLK